MNFSLPAAGNLPKSAVNLETLRVLGAGCPEDGVGSC